MLPFAFSVPHSDLKFCPYLISELFVYFSVSLNKTVNSLKLETESNPALYLENQVWYLALCSINYWIVKDYFFFSSVVGWVFFCRPLFWKQADMACSLLINQQFSNISNSSCLLCGIWVLLLPVTVKVVGCFPFSLSHPDLFSL